MKKNHFFFGYAGNKRSEVDKIHDYLKDSILDVKTIVEPFCGTTAFSVYMSLLYPKRFKYILNDFDPNITILYNLARNKDKFDKFINILNKITMKLNKEIYMKLVKEKQFIGWFISHLIYAIRAGLYNLEYKNKIYNFDEYPIVKFLRNENIEIINGDGTELVMKYQDNKEYLLFIDPPYIASCNEFYSSKVSNIYEYCEGCKIETMKAVVCFVLENNWIIRLLFKNNVKSEYKKLYQGSKKHTTHLIISNIK